MEVFEHYYKANQILLSCVGLWPYQKMRDRRVIITIGYSTLGLSLFTQLAKLIETAYDFDFYLRSLAYIVPTIAYYINYISFHKKLAATKILLEMMEHDWTMLKEDVEFEILRKYNELGRQITLGCTIFIYGGISAFVLVLFAPKILDIITPLNETRLPQFPVAAEYYIDQQKYVYYILLHMILVVVLGLTMILATSMLFVIFCQHACGMFKIASFRIQKVMGDTALNIPAVKEERTILASIIRAVSAHRRATKLMDGVLSAYSLCYFLLLILFMISASMNLYRLVQALSLMTSANEILNSVIFVCGHYQILFLFNYAIHLLTERSCEIYESTYSGCWYDTSLHVQKMILLVLLRGAKNYKPSVANMFFPSLEGFAQITSTSFSYFTVIYSMR